MTQTAKPIRYDTQNIFPYIMVESVDRLIDFLQAVFNAKLLYKLDRNDGTVMHAEVQIENNRIMMGEPTAQIGAMPISLYIHVENCDKVYQAALNAGATSIMEVTTMQHAGERYGGVKDFAGNIWWIASHVEDITLEESQQRIKDASTSSE